MTSVKPVVILTGELDPHADNVIVRLKEMGVPVFRIHTSDFPDQSFLTIYRDNNHAETHATTHLGTLNLLDIRSIWLRRPTPASFSFDPEIAEFAERETSSTLKNLFRSLDCMWVNHPVHNDFASNKLVQLKLARECEFDIPKTLVTNDPSQFDAFRTIVKGKLIYKTISGSGIGISYPGRPIFTSVLDEDVLQYADRIRYTPCLFQEYVEKKCDLRVTVIGSEIFAVEIYGEDHKPIEGDSRKTKGQVKHYVHELPQDVERKCFALLERLHLLYGAIDMIITPDGRYVFLEINPSGQYLWIEASTGLRLSSSMANLLAKGVQ